MENELETMQNIPQIEILAIFAGIFLILVVFKAMAKMQDKQDAERQEEFQHNVAQIPSQTYTPSTPRATPQRPTSTHNKANPPKKLGSTYQPSHTNSTPKKNSREMDEDAITQLKKMGLEQFLKNLK